MRPAHCLLLLALAWVTPAVAQDLPSAAAAQPTVEAMARAGRHADASQLPAAMQALQSSQDAEVRVRAAWALGRIKDGQAVPVLVAALKQDAQRRVRREAALALSGLGGKEAQDALLDVAAKDSDEQVVAACLEALGRTGGDAARNALAVASLDPRPLVALTAKRTASIHRLKTAPKPPSSAPELTPTALLPVCREGQTPPDCVYRRGRSSGGSANALFIAGGAVLGGLSGAFAGEALRPSRLGVRVGTRVTGLSDNTASPLERAVLGAAGAALGAGSAALWTLVDDVTFTRLSLVGALTLEAAAVGAGAGLAFRWPRNATAFSMIGLAGATAVAATGITFIPHDFSFGDVAWVWGNAAMGTGAGMLAALVVIPSGVGRNRNRLGRIRDVGELAGLSNPVFPLPWGEVGRLELVVASGLVSGAAASLLSASTLGLYEVGLLRVLKTVGAAFLTAMMVGLPPMLLLPDLPTPLPSTERVAAGLALASGAVAGGLVFAFSNNDEGQGPLVYLDTGKKQEPTAARPAATGRQRLKSTGGVALAPPGLAVIPPAPGSSNTQPGVYLGLVNARF